MMLGRGRGFLESKFKAKNDDGTLNRNNLARVGVVIVVAVVLLLVFPYQAVGIEAGSPSETTQTTPTTTPEPSAAEVASLKKAKHYYALARLWRHRADRWHHRLRGTHVPAGHRVMVFTGKENREYRRYMWWKKVATSLRGVWLSEQAEINACRHAGFPRWYCPILIKAAKRKHVRNWAHSPSLAFIISHESGFNPRADNSTSTAYGLFQMLTERSSDPHQQTLNGLRYIKGRYGSPGAAEAFWHSHHWY